MSYVRLCARPTLFLLLVVASSMLSGCIIHADSHVHNAGRAVGPQTLAQIEPGKTKEFVTALLGDPTSTTSIEDGTEI